MLKFISNIRALISGTEAQGISSVLITIMVAVVIGMVAVAVISPIVSQTTELQDMTNDTFNSGEFDDWSYDEANATGSSGKIALDNNDIRPASEVIENATDTASTYVRGVDYLFYNASGHIEVLASSDIMFNNTAYHATYDYWHDSYIASGIARSIVKLLPLMLALAIFLAVCAVGLKTVG